MSLGYRYRRGGEALGMFVGGAAHRFVDALHLRQRLLVERMVRIVWIAKHRSARRRLLRGVVPQRPFQRALRLRPNFAIHGELVVALECFHGKARVGAEVAVHLQGLAAGILVAERIEPGLQVGYLLPGQRLFDGRIGQRPRLAVGGEAMVALERFHCLLSGRAERAIARQRLPLRVGIAQRRQVLLQLDHRRAATAIGQHGAIDRHRLFRAAAGGMTPGRIVPSLMSRM